MQTQGYSARIMVVITLGMALLGLLFLPLASAAQSGGGYDLSWSTIDGGGYTFSTGGGYELGGTIGQADAVVLSGGGYMLTGGFWSDVASAGANRVFLPIVLR
jgi:hypothetical protein